MTALRRPYPAFAILAALTIAITACSMPTAPPTVNADDEVQFSAAQLQEDFAALYSGLQRAHYDLYARRAKADYDARYAQMRAALTQPLTAYQASIRFQRFAAYGNVAHARVSVSSEPWEAFRLGGGAAFPLLLRFVDGRAWVRFNISDATDIAVGDQLLSVDGQPIQAWLAPLRELVSADNDYLNDTQLELRLPLLVWQHYGAQSAYRIAIQKPDGRVVQTILPAQTRADYEKAEAASTPQFTLDWNERIAEMKNACVAYLRPGPFYDNRSEAATPWDPTAFKAFIDQAFEQFADQHATSLVIDLRDNPGGDNSFSDHLLAWFADKPFRFTNRFEIRVSEQTIASNRARLDSTGNADSISAKLDAAYAGKALGSRVLFPIPWIAPRAMPRFAGRIVVLINRHTYSNAVSVAAIVQDYGFGEIIGEETSDLASTLGAMENFRLPHTQIEVGYPKALLLRPNDDPQARGVIPDHAIATPLVAVNDDVLAQVLSRAGTCDSPDVRAP